MRSLLPRAAGVAMFDSSGEVLLDQRPDDGPDLPKLVDDVAARRRRQPGARRRSCASSTGNQPVYLFWLRDDSRS